jgi:hypothetical protein
MIELISKFPVEAAYVTALQKRWIARRAIVREAERRCHAEGKTFRGRSRPIYAKEIAEEMEEKERILADKHRLLTAAAAGGAAGAGARAIKEMQLVRSESGVRQKARRRIVRPGLRGGSKASHRQNQHEAGGETTKGEGKKRFKVLDNSIERAAQMIAGNTASASLGSSNGESDERLQRLEDRFSSLESKIDRLLARSLNPARSSLSAGPAGSPTKAPAAAGAPAFSFTGAPAFSFASLLTPKGKSDTNLEA